MPVCDVRWTVGDQPPDISTRSQSSFASEPVAFRRITPLAIGDAVGREERDALSCEHLDQRDVHFAPQVGERDGEACPGDIERAAIGRVVVGQHHRAGTGLDAEAVEVGARRRGEHGAGPVVAAETPMGARSPRLLDNRLRPERGHNLPRGPADAMPGRAPMFPVIDAECGRARQ